MSKKSRRRARVNRDYHRRRAIRVRAENRALLKWILTLVVGALVSALAAQCGVRVQIPPIPR